MAWVSVVANHLYAANVEYIDPKLKFAIVDQGLIHGIEPGSNICVLDDQKFIISCGGVVIVKRTKAAIRLPIEEMKRIHLGSQVTLKEIYLKDDASPRGDSEGLPVFRAAKMRPTSLPPTVSASAYEKEQELSQGTVADEPPQQPAYVDSNPSSDLGGQVSGPVIEQNAQDPYADIDRLSDLIKMSDTRKDGKNLTWKELRERIVFRAFTVESQILYPIQGASTFNGPVFSTIPENNSTRSSMWNSANLKKKPTSGFSLQLAFMNPREINYNFGWRYFQKVVSKTDTRLDARFPRIVAHSAIEAESMGLWAQRLWRFKPFEMFFTDLGLGADFNVSDVIFKSNYESMDTTQDPLASGLIANAQSRLASISLRGSAAQIFKISRFNLSLALAVYAPIYNAHQSFQANTKVPAGGTLSSDETEDMKRAINHRKNRIAADLHAGIGCQF